MNKFKKLIFTTLMILMVVIIVEGAARLTYFIMYRCNYNDVQMYKYLKYGNYGSTDGFIFWWDQEIIHPYLGFVFDFKDDKVNKDTYGISITGNPVIKRQPGRLNVALLGGSVAASLAKDLAAALTRICRLPPQVATLALSGYKQPQQLLALTYFLALGAEYDLVINLDGYNDIVLPFTDNYRIGVNPFYPRNWNLRINRQPSKKILAEIGKVRYLRDLKEEDLAGINSSPYRWSAVYGLLKRQQIKRLNWRISRASTNLLKLQQSEVKKFEETGPLPEYHDPEQLYHEAAAVWARSSLLLDQLARSNGMEYYHFLQPNQYVKGSKVLTAAERRTAYLENTPPSQAALIGYPIIIRLGKKLLAKRINYFDATMVFAGVKKTVYIDVCCHYNQRGKDILIAYILNKVAKNPHIRPFFK
jgi:hypothetical protein